MKLINIPVLCALPRLFDKAVVLLTAEPEPTLDTDTASILRAENERLIQALVDKEEIISDILNPPVTEVTNNVEDKWDGTLSDIPPTIKITTDFATPTLNEVLEEMADLSALKEKTDDTEKQAAIEIYKEVMEEDTIDDQAKLDRIATLDAKVEKRLNKNVAVLNDKMKGTMTTTKKKKKRRTAAVCTVPFTFAHWDRTNFRAKQRLAWNKTVPKRQQHTLTAMYIGLNKEFNMTYSGDFYSNIIRPSNTWYKARSTCKPNDGLKFPTQKISDFKDLPHFYGE